MNNYTDTDIDEDMKLTRRDYIKILHHYQSKKASLSGSTKTIKERAHRILADKLCRCIKATASTRTRNIQDEGRRIAYCSRSIFNNRGLRQHGFQCKATANNRRRGRGRGHGHGHGRLIQDVTKTRRILRI